MFFRGYIGKFNVIFVVFSWGGVRNDKHKMAITILVC